MDIALENKHGHFYPLLNGSDLAEEHGLRTALIISLHTDRRCNESDMPSDGTRNRRGHWSDTYLKNGDLLGSRLWLLEREKVLPEVLRRAEDYSKEALQWLIDDGVAATVDVTAKTTGKRDLNLLIKIKRPDLSIAVFEFEDIWNSEIKHGIS